MPQAVKIVPRRSTSNARERLTTAEVMTMRRMAVDEDLKHVPTGRLESLRATTVARPNLTRVHSVYAAWV